MPARALTRTLAAAALVAAAAITACERIDRRSADPSEGREAVVARVVDGDTVRLEGGETVRLALIDAPDGGGAQRARTSPRARTESAPNASWRRPRRRAPTSSEPGDVATRRSTQPGGGDSSGFDPTGRAEAATRPIRRCASPRTRPRAITIVTMCRSTGTSVCMRPIRTASTPTGTAKAVSGERIPATADAGRAAAAPSRLVRAALYLLCAASRRPRPTSTAPVTASSRRRTGGRPRTLRAFATATA
jgi:hypothetical protein